MFFAKSFFLRHNEVISHYVHGIWLRTLVVASSTYSKISETPKSKSKILHCICILKRYLSRFTIFVLVVATTTLTPTSFTAQTGIMILQLKNGIWLFCFDLDCTSVSRISSRDVVGKALRKYSQSLEPSL